MKKEKKISRIYTTKSPPKKKKSKTFFANFFVKKWRNLKKWRNPKPYTGPQKPEILFCLCAQQNF